MNEVNTRRVSASIGGVAAGVMAALLLNSAAVEPKIRRDRGRNTIARAISPTFGLTTLLRETVSATTPSPAAGPSNQDASPLANQIKLERSVAEIEEEHLATGNAAMADALEMIERAQIGGSPRVMFSDDGILTLQWKRGEFGVALIFAGDGEASIAFKRPGQLYAENGVDVAISQEPPSRFKEALAFILG
jgi:hypothetical protein